MDNIQEFQRCREGQEPLVYRETDWLLETRAFLRMIYRPTTVQIRRFECYIIPDFVRDTPVVPFRYDIGYKLVQLQELVDATNRMIDEAVRGPPIPDYRRLVYIKKIEAELRLIDINLIC